jgi:hypothetical protein
MLSVKTHVCKMRRSTTTIGEPPPVGVCSKERARILTETFVKLLESEETKHNQEQYCVPIFGRKRYRLQCQHLKRRFTDGKVNRSHASFCADDLS